MQELEASTFRLGSLLRQFENTTCQDYQTRELPTEETARRSRRKPNNYNAQSSKTKTFNLTTFKLHALGHHAQWIRHVGTTDNYTTQTVTHIIIILFVTPLIYI